MKENINTNHGFSIEFELPDFFKGVPKYSLHEPACNICGTSEDLYEMEVSVRGLGIKEKCFICENCYNNYFGERNKE